MVRCELVVRNLVDGVLVVPPAVWLSQTCSQQTCMSAKMQNMCPRFKEPLVRMSVHVLSRIATN